MGPLIMVATWDKPPDLTVTLANVYYFAHLTEEPPGINGLFIHECDDVPYLHLITSSM